MILRCDHGKAVGWTGGTEGRSMGTAFAGSETTKSTNNNKKTNKLYLYSTVYIVEVQLKVLYKKKITSTKCFT